MTTYRLPEFWENALILGNPQGLNHRERAALKEWQLENGNPQIYSSSGKVVRAPFNGRPCDCMDYCTI